MPAAALARVRPQTSPPACRGQHTTAKYAGKSFMLSTAGGHFCIPSFGGYGGSVQYPAVNRSIELTVHTSIANIYGEPDLGSGSPLVYVNLHFHEGTEFGTAYAQKGGLTSASLQAGQPYTAFGIVAVGHLDRMFTPCYAIATSGKYGGVFPDLGELLSGVTITGDGFGVIEIYAGQQTSTSC
jgi:hypothetical protein